MDGSQLPLPASWAKNFVNHRDPLDKIDQIARDKLDAKFEIRLVLEKLSEKHGIAVATVNAGVRGYAEDMLDDVTYEVERNLEREIEQRDGD